LAQSAWKSPAAAFSKLTQLIQITGFTPNRRICNKYHSGDFVLTANADVVGLRRKIS
jgi:hypothetical protein